MENKTGLYLIFEITQLIKQISENETNSIYYDKFKEIYQFKQELINNNKIVNFLFLKLNNHVSIKYRSDYLNDNQIETCFKISGLMNLIKNEQDVNLNTINDILLMDFIMLKESHLDLIKILKIIYKNNIQDDLKEKLSYNTIEYFKKSITCLETSNYSNIYLANKLIKCISIFLNCKLFENKSNEYNLVIYSCLNRKNLLNENLYSEYQFFYAKLITFMIGLILKIQKEEHDYINLKELDIIYIQLDDDVLIDFNLMCLENQITNEKLNLFVFDLNAHVLFVKVNFINLLAVY
jgi:hypothetical protein